MAHQPYCKQWIDWMGTRWHTARCETRADITRYAIEQGIAAQTTHVDPSDSTFDPTANVVNYCREVANLIFG